MSTPEDFEKKLSESKSRYVAGLAAKLTELKLIWNQYQQEPTQTHPLIQMKMIVHGLVASGSTFGFTNLSEESKKLEQLLDSIIAQSTPLDVMQKESVNYAIIALEAIHVDILCLVPATPVIFNKTNAIAILDEDQETASTLSRQLAYYGCRVNIVTKIENLDKTLHQDEPMLILLDDAFSQQVIDNKTVIQQLRKKWLLDCPIIYLSKADDFESRMDALNAGCNAFFTKPMDISLLIERIRILTNAGIVEPYRVLLMENDRDLANHYALVLEKGGITVFLEHRPEMILTRIIDIDPELVVMDVYLPNYNGIDLLKLIRQHQAYFTLPVILLTSEDDRNLQYLAREVGVDDFLIKPISAPHLYDIVLSRVQRSRYTNISLSKDSLTGLLVHKKINEYLVMHLSIAKRYGDPLSYIIIDLDHFKEVNDTYGHLAGDHVLVTLGNVLKSSLRVTDCVGRYGGEEFVVILPQTEEVAAFRTIERILKKFAKTEHRTTDDRKFKVTFSAGISGFPKYADHETIMSMADKALYLSKKNGRNQINIG